MIFLILPSVSENLFLKCCIFIMLYNSTVLLQNKQKVIIIKWCHITEIDKNMAFVHETVSVSSSTSSPFVSVTSTSTNPLSYNKKNQKSRIIQKIWDFGSPLMIYCLCKVYCRYY